MVAFRAPMVPKRPPPLVLRALSIYQLAFQFNRLVHLRPFGILVADKNGAHGYQHV